MTAPALDTSPFVSLPDWMDLDDLFDGPSPSAAALPSASTAALMLDASLGDVNAKLPIPLVPTLPSPPASAPASPSPAASPFAPPPSGSPSAPPPAASPFSPSSFSPPPASPPRRPRITTITLSPSPSLSPLPAAAHSPSPAPAPKPRPETLTGTTSAEVRRMTPSERELVLYKRKLRNRESARRSRAKRQATLAELQDQVDDLALLGSRVLDMAAGLRRENDSLKKKLARGGGRDLSRGGSQFGG